MKLTHVISAEQFDKDTLEKIFGLADKIKVGDYSNTELNGKIMASLFYEPSTRTRFSFEAAMLKLGGKIISTENAREFSSAAKGETLGDTIRIVNAYADVIVLRHPDAGAAKIAAEFSKVPLINAGDGSGEHPTQAMLDLYTIFSKLKGDNFTIMMAGDLSHYRSVHSLSYFMLLYPKIKIVYVAPKALSIPENFRKLLRANKVDFEETEKFEETLPLVDVVYQTRIPKEYLDKVDYEKYSGKYILDNSKLKFLKKNALIMHPLPRIGEIAPEVDQDSRAIYFEQAENGLYTRMALLISLFDKT